ncbi:VirB8/TrbF family protein [Nocardia heshunensis]
MQTPNDASPSPLPHHQPPRADSSSRSIVPWVITGVVAALGVAGTATGFVLYAGERKSLTDERATSDQLRQQVSTAGGSAEARRMAAQQAACDFVTLVSTYNPATIDQYVTGVLNASTGEFHQTFAATGNDLRDIMKANHSVSKVAEIHCGAATMRDHAGTVVVALKQESSNDQKPNTNTAVIPMLVTVGEQGDGRWLVSAMDPIA